VYFDFFDGQVLTGCIGRAIENANATAIITAKIFFIRFPSKENI